MAEPNEESASELNEEEVIAGLLPFRVGGVTHLVPELKWRANREWQDRLRSTFLALASVPAETPEGQQTMADAERELVLAYDQTHVLGDLEDATEREIDAIYNRLMEVSFPLAQSQAALMVGIIRAAGVSALANSTNGPSSTGTSEAPMILKDHLPSVRSRSSSRRPRNASVANATSA